MVLKRVDESRITWKSRTRMRDKHACMVGLIMASLDQEDGNNGVGHGHL